MAEYHARDLANYYNSLAVHEHYNYYFGRAEANFTSWVEYFVVLLAKVFNQAKNETVKSAGRKTVAEPEKLRKLDHRTRTVFSLFAKKDKITTQDVADILGLSQRVARILLKEWIDDGWLIMANSSNRGRIYILKESYRQFIGNK